MCMYVLITDPFGPGRAIGGSVCLFSDDELETELALTCVFGTLFHIDNVYVKCDGQGHR